MLNFEGLKFIKTIEFSSYVY